MSIYKQFTEKERAILKARAERVAQQLRVDEHHELVPALVIHLGEERYAVAIDSIAVVHENIAIEPVPCVPGYIAGIANVRGHIIPVIDLRVLLGISREVITGRANLIVAEDGSGSVAFYVDGIGNVENLAMEHMLPVPAAFAAERVSYLKGMMPDGLAVLDMRAILADPSLVVDEQGL